MTAISDFRMEAEITILRIWIEKKAKYTNFILSPKYLFLHRNMNPVVVSEFQL